MILNIPSHSSKLQQKDLGKIWTLIRETQWLSLNISFESSNIAISNYFNYFFDFLFMFLYG